MRAQGWGDVGFNDQQIAHTPNLDRLANTGVIFTDFHTASPVCSPSRVGFLTGRDPARLRIHTALNVNWTANAAEGQANYLDPKVPTITSLLQDAGWSVGHFGKWHLGSGASPTNKSVMAPLPTAYGIDASCTFNSNDACQADGSSGNTSVDILDRGMNFIRAAAQAGVPFYINIWLHVSHNKLDPTAAQKAAVRPGHGACKARSLATNQTVCAQEIFVAAQQDADAQIGRLVTLLGELNLHESTMVLFSTDNGPEEQAVYSNAQGSAGPFRGRKRSLYEGGTRVPSFFVWGGGTPRPTIPKGAVDHTPISATDWLPTVAAIAGIALPRGLQLDGEDMSHVILRKTSGQRDPTPRRKLLFWEWRYGVSGPCDNSAPHLAVRDGDWKYLMNADGSRAELYRLDVYNRSNPAPDFHERANLVESFPQKASALAGALAAWHATLPPIGPQGWVRNLGCEGFSSSDLRPTVFGSQGCVVTAAGFRCLWTPSRKTANQTGGTTRQRGPLSSTDLQRGEVESQKKALRMLMRNDPWL